MSISDSLRISNTFPCKVISLDQICLRVHNTDGEEETERQTKSIHRLVIIRIETIPLNLNRRYNSRQSFKKDVCTYNNWEYFHVQTKFKSWQTAKNKLLLQKTKRSTHTVRDICDKGYEGVPLLLEKSISGLHTQHFT